jgi:LCP family protein required for cell wall assembly
MTDDSDPSRIEDSHQHDEAYPKVSYFSRDGWRLRHARRRARRAKRSTSRRWLIRSGIALGLLIVIIVGSTTGYSFYRLGQILRITSANVVPVTGPSENILLIGSTDRCAATKIKQYQLQCENGVNGINSDVVLIMHLDPSTGKVSLLSIPRDTFVPNARKGGLYNKVDAALYDGPDQLVAAIEQDFGIPINHFVELNFQTFANVVNALGGLYMYFPDRLVDASSLLNVHHAGCIYFNGTEALELVRSRHLYWFTKGETPNLAAIQAATDNGTYYTSDSGGQYDGSGDLGRITRVHLFLKALASAVTARGFGNPITDNALIGAIAGDLTVDSTFSDSQILSLALDFRNLHIDNVPELTIPIVNDAVTYNYKGYPYGLVVFPTEPQDQQAINAFLGTKPAGLKLATSSITISVVDGTDSTSATSTVATELGRLGYRMVSTTATNDVGPVSETTVEYAKGHLEQAERVMSSLAGTVVLGMGVPANGADVSVIAGSDLSVAHITATSSGKAVIQATITSSVLGDSRSAASVTPQLDAVTRSITNLKKTTLPTPVTGNANLGTPTLANPPAAPYDPRSCPVTSK